MTRDAGGAGASAVPRWFRARQRRWRPQVLPTYESMTAFRGDLDAMAATPPDDAAAVSDLEAAFVDLQGGGHAVAFDAGRTALAACLAALRIGPGDEVIVPAYTCIVVPNAIRAAGAKPVLVDIELATWGLDAAAAEAAITQRTRAILVQHTYGIPSRDTGLLLDLAADRGVAVVEDVAHATGATWRGRPVGRLGDIGFTSMERSKCLSTVMGGVAFADDDALALSLRRRQSALPTAEPAHTASLTAAAWHGYYRFQHPLRRFTKRRQATRFAAGPPSTPPRELRGGAHAGAQLAAPLAALGIGQVKRLPAINDLRRANAKRHMAWCREQGYGVAEVPAAAQPVWLRVPFRVPPEQKADSDWLHRASGFHAGHWFAGNLHPDTRRVPNHPNAATAVQETLNLPGLL